MALKIKNRSGAPTELLKEGEPYLDKDSGDLYMGDGEQNIRYQKAGYTEPDIKVASGTIPAIPADTREVVQVNLGVLNNKTQALIGFFLSTAVDTEIQKELSDINGFAKDYQILAGASSISPLFSYVSPAGIGITPLSYNKILVFPNYEKAIISKPFGDTYDVDSSIPAPNNSDGYPAVPSYENIGAGVLVGWYSFMGNGFLEIDKKVQCESAWLTQDGDNTILNIALKNVDTEANTAKDIKVAVYE